MDKHLGLGWSAISKSEFSSSRGGAWRRLFLFLVGLVVIGFVFAYITKEIQSNTAHATHSHVEWEPSSE
jgi:hypothetical protein